MFSGCTVPPDSKGTELGSFKRLLHQQIKIGGSFSDKFARASASLQLLSVV